MACIMLTLMKSTGEGKLEGLLHSALCTLHMLRQSVREAWARDKGRQKAGSRLLWTGSTVQGSRFLQRPTIRRIRRIRECRALGLSKKASCRHLHILKRAKQQITRYPVDTLIFGWRLPERFD